MKIFFGLFFCLMVSLGGLCIVAKNPLSQPKLVIFDLSQEKNLLNCKYPRVLQFGSYANVGSVETHIWNTQKIMLEQSKPMFLAVCENTLFQKKLCEEKIPHFVLSTSRRDWFFRRKAVEQLTWICDTYKIDIIHAHTKDDASLACAAVKYLPTKVVLSYHLHGKIPARKIKNIQGVIAVNKNSLDFMEQESLQAGLKIKVFKNLFPLIDTHKFLSYISSSDSRSEFFLKNYQIKLLDGPVISMVAQFYRSNSWFFHDYRKNHELLIKATEYFVHEEKIPLNIIFVGSGPALEWHKKLVSLLKLEQNIHFLGHCSNTQDIFHYSDFHVLASKEEAFGMVHLEAGLMKIPSIGARDTGAEYSIVHKKTGLLFENNSIESLVEAIQFFIDHPDSIKEFGKNAFKLAQGKQSFDKTNMTFLPSYHIQELANFYAAVSEPGPIH